MEGRRVQVKFGGFRRTGIVTVLACAALMVAACSGSRVGTTSSEQRADVPQVTITPADGDGKAAPDKGIRVKVEKGILQNVTVRAKGKKVPGRFSADRTSWRTRWTLAPGASYHVAATAANSEGGTATATSRFTTRKASQSLSVVDVTPMGGETVGVGMPITVRFNRPVGNRKAVERALEVRSERPARGAWLWVDDTQVIFRTRRFWRANQKITLIAHLMGVRSARGVYGTADYTRKFTIGDAHVSAINAKTHRMVVRRNGEKIKNVGISVGKGGRRMYTTTNGVHLTMDKGNPVVMTSGWMGVTDKKDPDYYKLTVQHAVRISDSGEYIHSAPWSVGSQGRANVSHGCVNASPEFARWFYGFAQRGDVVTVTGTDRELEWNNGWGYWQLPWRSWVKGSALKKSLATAKKSLATARAGATSSPTPDGRRSAW